MKRVNKVVVEIKRKGERRNSALLLKKGDRLAGTGRRKRKDRRMK